VGALDGAVLDNELHRPPSKVFSENTVGGALKVCGSLETIWTAFSMTFHAMSSSGPSWVPRLAYMRKARASVCFTESRNRIVFNTTNARWNFSAIGIGQSLFHSVGTEVPIFRAAS
jgi:hypothetical protein